MEQDSRHCISFATLHGAAAGLKEPSDALVDFIFEKVRVVLGRNSPDSDEATSDVYLKIINAIHSGKFNANKEGKPSSWVTKIAVRVAIDYRRSATRYCAKFDAYDDGAELTDPQWVDPSLQLEQYQRAALARSFLEDLDEDHRAVILLRYYEELSLEEVADTLDIPVGTVKSRLSRAESRLRAAIAKTQRPDEAPVRRPFGASRRRS
jgi:RNA polymerase sigma-70 factor (ECF subfamily)